MEQIGAAARSLMVAVRPRRARCAINFANVLLCAPG